MRLILALLLLLAPCAALAGTQAPSEPATEYELRIAEYALGKNHGRVIGPALSHEGRGCLPRNHNYRALLLLKRPKCFTYDQYEAVKRAIVKRMLDNEDRDRCKPCVLSAMEMRSLQHMMDGRKITTGDFVLFHGMLKQGYSPETFVLGKKFEEYMKCVGTLDPATAAECKAEEKLYGF